MIRFRAVFFLRIWIRIVLVALLLHGGVPWGPMPVPLAGAGEDDSDSAAGSASYYQQELGIFAGGAPGAPTLLDRRYDYDGVGNIMDITAEDPRYDQDFAYDALHRLTRHSSGLLEHDETFSYTSTGNLVSKNGVTYAYNAGTHQAISDGVNTYSYDRNGNLASKNDITFRYDADNRLLELSSGARFEYDYSGRRVKKTEGTRATYAFNEYYEEETTEAGEPVSYLLWTYTGDASAPPLPEETENGPTATRYYFLNGLRVAKATNGEFTWIHSDHLHSATILTDESGAEVRRLAYRAFGEELENQGTGNGPKYSYTGRELDSSGLMYYGARYYDPALSRFITPDTVYDGSSPQGLNRYSYVLNNPILYIDPTGHAHWYHPYTTAVSEFHESVNREFAQIDEASGYNPVVVVVNNMIVKTATDVGLGIIESGAGLIPLGEQIGEWGADPTNPNKIPVVGPAGEKLGTSVGEAIVAPSIETISKAIAATAEAVGIAVGGVQSARMLGFSGTPKKLFKNLAPQDQLDATKLVDYDTIKSQKLSIRSLNYVVTEDGQLVIGKRFDRPGGGHIDLAHGKPVQAAGEVRFVNGEVKSLNNKSGHYKPYGKSAQNAALEAFGIDDASLYIEEMFD